MSVSPTTAHLLVKWNSQVIADTHEALTVTEGSRAPAYYLPRSALNVDIKKNDQTTWCPHKGEAVYYDVVNEAGETAKARIWSYETPKDKFGGIKEYLAFYQGPWEVTVDGKRA